MKLTLDTHRVFFPHPIHSLIPRFDPSTESRAVNFHYHHITGVEKNGCCYGDYGDLGSACALVNGLRWRS